MHTHTHMRVRTHKVSHHMCKSTHRTHVRSVVAVSSESAAAGFKGGVRHPPSQSEDDGAPGEVHFVCSVSVVRSARVYNFCGAGGPQLGHARATTRSSTHTKYKVHWRLRRVKQCVSCVSRCRRRRSFVAVCGVRCTSAHTRTHTVRAVQCVTV